MEFAVFTPFTLQRLIIGMGLQTDLSSLPFTGAPARLEYWLK